MKLRLRLLILGVPVLTAGLGICLAGYLSFLSARNILIEERGHQLMGVVTAQRAALEEYFESWQGRLMLAINQREVRSELSTPWRLLNRESLEVLHHAVSDVVTAHQDIHGLALMSLDKQVIVSGGESTTSYQDWVESPAFKLEGSSALLGIRPSNSGPVMGIAVPIQDRTTLVAFAVAEVSADYINTVAKNYNGLGETGETLIARRLDNGDAEFIVPLRHDRLAAFNRTIVANRDDVPIILALAGVQQIIIADIVDYRDEPVLAATQYLEDMDLALLTKIDRREALAAANPLGQQFFIIGLVVILVSLMVMIVPAELVLRSIRGLSQVAQDIRAGNRESYAEPSLVKELHDQAMAFNMMVENQNQAITESELAAAYQKQSAAVAERESQRSARDRKRLRAVLNASMDGILTVNEEGVVEIYNAACETMFGLGAETVIGQSVSLLGIRVEGEQDSTELINNGRMSPPDTMIGKRQIVIGQRSDGSRFPLELSFNKVKLTDHSIFIGSLQDISERMADEEERQNLIERLTKSNTELERFAHVAAHDLQEPLRQVQNFTELLRTRYGDKLDEMGARYVQICSSSAARMQDLVKDLMDYSRLDDGDDKSELFETEEILGFVRANLSKLINDTGAEITNDPLPEIFNHPVRFSRVVQNLIGNALKYQDPDNRPKIHISVEDIGGEWRFAVTDNGIGMKPEHCEQIFQPFKRLHNKKAFSGTGIGLAICRKLLTSMGGKIWAESELGQGATFYFTLPRTIAKDASSSGAAA